MISALIDISAEFGPVRDQASRPVCLAMAMSDIHSHQRQSKGLQYSAEFAFYHAANQMPPAAYHDGLTFSAIATALANTGQPYEASYPFLPGLSAADPLPVPALPKGEPIFRTTSVSSTPVSGLLSSFISMGKPAVVVVNVSDGFLYGPASNAPIYYSAGERVAGLHAVVLVGYGMDTSGEECFLIRNSWGQGWGALGHAWLHGSFINNCVDSVIHTK